MDAVKRKLALLESRLETLIEGSAARLFPGKGIPQRLANRLVEAMQASIRPGPNGEPMVPGLFILAAHPEQALALQNDHALLNDLTSTIRESGQDAGLRFLSPPIVRVVAAPRLAPGEIQVIVRDVHDDLPQTAAVPVAQESGVEGVPAGVALIVNGVQVFRISRAVVNIGRSMDNHLVINNPGVSRRHAQLRFLQGQFVIFDLDSTGGTWVNGKRVQQHSLQHGDVISLSGVPLVFTQEDAGLNLSESPFFRGSQG